jgi:hypothetical protein
MLEILRRYAQAAGARAMGGAGDCGRYGVRTALGACAGETA